MRQLFTIVLLLFASGIPAQTISTIAGTGVWACTGTGGPATTAGVGQLSAVTVDAAGNVYIGAITCRKVFKIDPTGVITTFAGTGVGGSTGDGGPATAATLGLPSYLAADRFGNIFISDNDNSVIRKVNAAGIISTIAGDASVMGGGYSGDGGPASAALLQWPEGIAVDTSGNLYVADNGNNMIRKISVSGIITRIAGNGSWTYSGDGGPALVAGLQAPRGLAIDNRGNIYVSHDISQRIRKINTSGIISCIAGNGTSGYTGDGGPGTAASLRYPRGLATDKYRNVYIADGGNHAIRMVDTNNAITTFAGMGGAGHSGDGGPAYLALINYPYDVAIDNNGYKYIAEVNGAYLRKADTCLPPVIAAILGDTALCPGDTVLLTDTTAGGFWSVSDTSVAKIDAAGYLAVLTRGIVTVSYSKSNSCATMSRTREIVAGPFAGTIFSPGHTPDPSGVDTFCYDAFLAVTGPPGGTWGLTNTTIASISSSGSIMPLTFPTVDTAFYAVTDTCGSDTAFFPFVLIWCPDRVNHTAKTEISFRIYPNPVSSQLHLVSDVAIVKVVILSMPGQLVSETTCNSKEAVIDVALLPAGMYMLKVDNLPPCKFVKY